MLSRDLQGRGGWLYTPMLASFRCVSWSWPPANGDDGLNCEMPHLNEVSLESLDKPIAGKPRFAAAENGHEIDVTARGFHAHML